MLPLLRIATADEHRLSDATKALAQQRTLSEAERIDLLPLGNSPVASLAAVWYHRGRSASRSATTMPYPATPTYPHPTQEEEAPTPAEMSI